ncbi:hypothetical protein H2202_006592 [Exophiala xenobiotica]|nr:hypothetical protein H2202_006592 [Exophiala xenobiotica]
MFFIVPDRKASGVEPTPASNTSSSPSHNQKRQRLSPEAEQVAGYYPKRNQKSCDRCRLKKARCSGGRICERCKRDGVICTTNRESKRDPNAKPLNAEYVHLVESQRDALLSALRTIYEKGASSNSAALSDILKDLGIGVEDLKRMPRRTASQEHSADLDDVDLRRNAAEIQALLSEWNIPITQPEAPHNLSTWSQGHMPTTVGDSNDGAASDSGLQYSLDTTFPTGMTGPISATTAGQKNPTEAVHPTSEFDDWLVTDTFDENWPLSVDDGQATDRLGA